MNFYLKVKLESFRSLVLEMVDNTGKNPTNSNPTTTEAQAVQIDWVDRIRPFHIEAH